MNDEEDPPVPQRLRVVTVLDATPGRADDPEYGLPIGIVTLAHKGDLEQPLMLHLRDVRKLAVSLMRVLAHFGDEEAENIVEGNLGRLTQIGDFVVPANVAVTDTPLGQEMQSNEQGEEPTTADQSILQKMTVMFPDETLPPMTLEVLGGYFWKNVRMFLYRCHRFGAPVESVAKLKGDLVQLDGHLNDEVLPREKWANFCSMRPGATILIGKRWWRRYAPRQIEILIQGKVFRLASPRRPT